MAIRHGLSGQYAKGEAILRHYRIMLIIGGIGGFGLFAMGFIGGYFWHRFGSVLAVLGVLTTEVLIYLTWKISERYLNTTAKQRMRFMRGGQGEALIAWLLEDLDDNWHIFNGIKLRPEYDIDHIVVGPGGLFCISTKSHRGSFAGTPEGLLQNGEPSPFAKEAMSQAMDLRDRLTAAIGPDVPWIQPILAVPFGHTIGNACNGKVWLVHQDDILHRLCPDPLIQRLANKKISCILEILARLQLSSEP